MTRKRMIVSLFLGISAFAGLLASKETTPWKDQYVQVGDIKTHYLDAGSGDRILIFIPGWTLAAEVWKEQIPYFAARGFRVIAYDPRSQGLTTKTEVGNIYHQHAADLHAFLKTLKLEHASFVGWGAGASALLEYVASPETLRPDNIILVDCTPSGFKEGDYPGGMTMQQARTALSELQEDRKKAADKFVRGLFKSRQPEITYKEMTDASLRMPIGSALSLFFDFFTGDRRRALEKIATPALVFVTPENRLLGDFMVSKIPRAKLEVVEAGSAMFLEKPQTFNQLLEAFLGQQ